MGGAYVRRSLDLTSWEAAQDRERSPTFPTPSSGSLTTSRAGLSEATIGKQNVLLRKQFLPWCKTVDRQRKSRRRLEASQSAASTNLAFRPGANVGHPQGMRSLIEQRHLRRTQLHVAPRAYAVDALFRLRIGDAVTCARDRVVDSKLLLDQAKTGTPVYCPLPPVVVDALNEVDGPNATYFFWTGNGKTKSAVADAQRSFRKLFELAEVKGHPHMFRDTFAVELLKHGVSLETVSMLLGDVCTARMA